MVIKQHYYYLEEREFSEVSVIWKATHIAICIIISITGFLCAFSFGSLLEKFDYNCLLYTDIHFINNSAENASTTKLQLPVTIPASFNETDVPIYETLNSTNTTEPSNIEPVSKSPLNITIDHENTLWRPQTSCHFTQFVPIISMIFAIILGTFFFLAPKGGKGHHSVINNAWSLVYPALLCSSIMIIVTFWSATKLNSGLTHFYNQWNPDLKSSDFVVSFKNIEDVFPTYYKMTIATAYIGAGGWICQVALLMLRVFCVADFVVRRVQIEEKIRQDDDDNDEDFIDEVVHEILAPRDGRFISDTEITEYESTLSFSKME